MSKPGFTGRQPLFKYAELSLVKKIIADSFEPLGVEVLHVKRAVGRYIAEDITAPVDLPNFSISHVDGYAVSECDSTVYRVVKGDLKNPCEAVYVNTGEPVPEGALFVAPVEAVRVLGNDYIEVHGKHKKHEEIIAKGSDVQRGFRICRRGDLITPSLAKLLIDLGFEEIKVYRRPRVLVLPVGSEFTSNLKRESSSSMVKAMCESVGAVVNVEEPVEDSIEIVRSVVENALSEHDAVVTIGGVSLGEHDVTLTALLSISGSTMLVRGLRVQPGRTTSLVLVKGKPVVLLPGLVQSTVSGSIFLAQPLIKRLQGSEPVAHYPVGYYKLAEDYVYKGRFLSFTRIRFAKLVNTEDLEVVIEEAPSPLQRVIYTSYGFVLIEPGVSLLRKGTLVKLYRSPGLYI
ncbi:MAG: molybdopterin molybdotransferase MoeA [Desulfurococcaceae archaeon]